MVWFFILILCASFELHIIIIISINVQINDQKLNMVWFSFGYFWLENVDFTFLFSSAYDILSEEDKRKNYDMYLEAYLVLSDEDKRKNYDMCLDEKAQFGGTTRCQSGIRTINSEVFQKEIADQGITWLLLSYTPTLKGYQHIESIIEEVGSIMRGALRYSSVFTFYFYFCCHLTFLWSLCMLILFSLLTGWKHKLWNRTIFL